MNFMKLSSAIFRFEPLPMRVHEHVRNLTVPAGTPGAGAGKGGGSGGTVRESGGGLGKYGAAQEEGYFYGKQKEQLKKIKQRLQDEKELSQKKDE